MKRTFLLFAAFAGFTALRAQVVKEGTIVYEQKVNNHKLIQDEQMRAMMPEFRTAKYSLSFSDSISVYKLVPEDEAPDPFAGGGNGPRMIMRFGGGSGDLFKNFAQSKSVQESEVGGKNYLIVDSIKQQPWKLETETKTILGYTCHKATRKISQPAMTMRMITSTSDGSSDTTKSSSPGKTKEVEIVAWYADNITSPGGPDNYGQLPGVILQLDVDNGTTVYNAVEVKKSVDQKDLKEPKKGKVVTRQEFTKIISDMMGVPAGGSGNRVIRFGGE